MRTLTLAVLLCALPAIAQEPPSNDPADYSGQKLRHKDFTNTDLTGANLSGADLHSAKLTGATFHNANMRGVQIYYVDMKAVSFDGADLSNAKLDSNWAQGASFRGANLRGASFWNTKLNGADFTDADLTGADLRRADLTGADLTGATIDGINVESAIIRDVAGLDDATADRLRGEAGRFWFDLSEAFNAFVFEHSMWVYLVLLPLGIVLAFMGFRGAPEYVKVSSFVQLGINGGALIPGLAMIFMMLGHVSPVRQMSGGSGWGVWFAVWPVLLLLAGVLVLVAIISGATHAFACAVAKPRYRPALSVTTALVTLANTLLAVCVLFQLAPDA